jgi:serine/threonine-protein kinase
MNTLILNNRYQILETLGRGGFGETFLAIDTHMPSSRKCVIKRLQPTTQSPRTPDWLCERFQREAAILEELGERHSQIPKLYAYFTENGQFYLVQEWIEGQTLTEFHQQKGNLSEETVREILLSLLPVLSFIHGHRVIHRDIKPDNIILRAKDRLPVLIDFGIIKETMATAIGLDGQSAYSLALGTPGYMASEQAAGRPVYSSDLYSLALTAFFLLTGKSPQYLESDPHTGELSWRADVPQLHSSLATVLERAIRFHPRDRFPSAKAMLAALNASSLSQSPTRVVIPQVRPSVSQAKVNSPSSRAIPPKAKARPQKSGMNPPHTKHSKADSIPVGESPEISWGQWMLLSLLAFGLTAGAFILGFNLLIERDRPQTTPPEENLPPENNDPQTFPNPTATPTPRPARRPKPQPTPEAAPAPEPIPEAAPAPEPIPEAAPAPEPIPEAAPAPSPSPKPVPKQLDRAIPIPVPPPDSQSEPEAKPSIPADEPDPTETRTIAPPQPKRPISVTPSQPKGSISVTPSQPQQSIPIPVPPPSEPPS